MQIYEKLRATFRLIKRWIMLDRRKNVNDPRNKMSHK